MDLHLSVSDGFVSSLTYDKRNDFAFDIENFPFLDGDVPRSISYAVYISQLFGLLECLVMLLISIRVIKVSPTGLSVLKASKDFLQILSPTLVIKFNVGLKTLLH